MVANARDFLFAVKESTHTTFDADACDFLDNLRLSMTVATDAGMPNLTRGERDALMFFEGMLRGVMLQLKRKSQHDAARLQKLGLWGPDGPIDPFKRGEN